MIRIVLLVLLCMGAISCQDEKPQSVSSDTSDYEISIKNWPKKSKVKEKAQEILKDWTEYDTFDTSFDALYTVENRDDLELTIENLIEKQNTLETSSYPKAFDKPQVKSRQKIFKTYMLKVKGDLFYRTDPQESVIEMIDAYSAFRNQFNVIVNNTLNLDILMEE